jgi:hypothetical protein
MPKSASPRAVAAEWFRRLRLEHDGSVIAELMAPDARGELDGGVVTHGPEEFAYFHRVLLGTLPDIQAEVLEIVEEGTQAYVRWVDGAPYRRCHGPGADPVPGGFPGYHLDDGGGWENHRRGRLLEPGRAGGPLERSGTTFLSKKR